MAEGQGVIAAGEDLGAREISRKIKQATPPKSFSPMVFFSLSEASGSFGLWSISISHPDLRYCSVGGSFQAPAAILLALGGPGFGLLGLCDGVRSAE